jgi:hypothetical protein
VPVPFLSYGWALLARSTRMGRLLTLWPCSPLWQQWRAVRLIIAFRVVMACGVVYDPLDWRRTCFRRHSAGPPDTVTGVRP